MKFYDILRNKKTLVFILIFTLYSCGHKGAPYPIYSSEKDQIEMEINKRQKEREDKQNKEIPLEQKNNEP